MRRLRLAVAALAPAVALLTAASAAQAQPNGTQAPTTTVSNDPYPVPSPLPAGKPGALISSDKLTLPVSGSSYRVLYHSKAVDGRDIAVSGVVFVPPGTPPKGGWPLVSFAHGTTGIADKCAPSRNIGMTEQSVATLFAVQGWAIAQTDYEGLGTPGRHPYVVGVSEGRGVLDIARAAQKIPGAKIGPRVVVWGHSQGGHAALFAGELAPTYAPDLKVLGVVAGAPPSGLRALVDRLATSKFRGYVFMVAAGFKAAYPDLDLNAVLTPPAVQRLGIVDTACTDAVFKAFETTPYADLVKPAGLDSGAWAAKTALNEPGTKKIAAPVLIVHGDKDEQIPVDTSATLQQRMCKLGTSVERRVYAGQDHRGAALASISDVMVWMADRLAGKKAVANCAK